VFRRLPRPISDFARSCETDRVFRSYVWCAIAMHVFALLYFAMYGLLGMLSPDKEAICWPFFGNCWRFRLSDHQPLEVLLAYGAIAVLTLIARAARDYVSTWYGLALLNVWLAGIVALDYRMRSNEVYMLLWLNAVVLLWPHKRYSVPAIIVSFYWWAGTLKLNYEWLSGASLYGHLAIVPARLTWVACTYVVGMEMGIVLFLLSGRRWVRNTVLAQLAAFHLESLTQIIWFYPLLMAAVLAWFVIENAFGARAGQGTRLDQFLKGKAPVATYVLCAVFAAFQLAPYLYKGDKELTGQGRIFALHMFESRQECAVTATIHAGGQPANTVDLVVHDLPPRMVCDPLIYFDRASNICRGNQDVPGFDIDLKMVSKRSTAPQYTTIIDDPGFCSKHEKYKIFGNNSWLK